MTMAQSFMRNYRSLVSDGFWYWRWTFLAWMWKKSLIILAVTIAVVFIISVVAGLVFGFWFFLAAIAAFGHALDQAQNLPR